MDDDDRRWPTKKIRVALPVRRKRASKKPVERPLLPEWRNRLGQKQ